MKRNHGRFLQIGVLLSVSGLSSCSLEPASKQAKFFIELSPEHREERLDPLQVLYPDFSFSEIKAPPGTDLSTFACLAVNITGPGIPNTSGSVFGTLNQRFNATFNDQSFCSYRGIMKGPIFPQSGTYVSQTVEAVIPTGSPRLIQIVGVSDATACAPDALGAGSFSSYGDGRFFEVGRAKIGNVFSDLSVTIANQWPSSFGAGSIRKMDCPDCGILHQSSLTQDGSEGVGAGNAKMAQSFVVGSAGRRLSSVQFIVSVGGATNANVSVVRDSAGAPSVATLDIVDTSANVPIPAGSDVTIEAPFSAGMVLAPGVYWIVVSQGSGSFNLMGNMSTEQGPYPAKRFNSSGPWVDATLLKTILFKVVTCQ